MNGYDRKLEHPLLCLLNVNRDRDDSERIKNYSTALCHLRAAVGQWSRALSIVDHYGEHAAPGQVARQFRQAHQNGEWSYANYLLFRHLACGDPSAEEEEQALHRHYTELTVRYAELQSQHAPPAPDPRWHRMSMNECVALVLFAAAALHLPPECSYTTRDHVAQYLEWQGTYGVVDRDAVYFALKRIERYAWDARLVTRGGGKA